MTFGERLKHAAREPLVHFLLAGLLVFMLASWRGMAVDPQGRTIIIDEARVSWLARQFGQTWQRTPSDAEIDQLIRDYVTEEVYYREALRMGLDADDPIIRRRLRSKMEFLAAAAVESAAPSDADLQAWLDKYPARYAADTQFSFDQIFVGQAGEPDIAKRAADKLAQLQSGKEPARLGRDISLPARMEAASATSVTNVFGEEFTASLATVKTGSWVGPVPSGFGLHLVRITGRRPGALPKLADVRQRLENDWRAESLADRQARAYQALLDGYTVRIEKP